jgi:tyrosyl-tRNA synthetase
MAISTDPKKIEHLLHHRVDHVVGDLRLRLAAGKKLRVKLGADPTSPDLHLGHAVALRKLREFQDLGHQVVFIVGDYTAMIGDPTGKSKTRPALTKKEVLVNAKTYLAQAKKILSSKNLEVRMNGEWLSKLKFQDVLQLTAQFTVARMIERDDFAKRLKEGVEVHMHELLYPMMQAYDSVMIDADVEIGGTDQMFNILAGRELQKKLGKPEQSCLFVGPLLVGTDGVKKMSKSLGNYVGLTDSPDDMFGKVMSIPDALIADWFTLATDVPKDEVAAMLASGKNPRDAKIRLAKEIIAQYHSAKAADAAEQHFISVFQKKETPEEIKVYRTAPGKRLLVDVLIETGFATSKSDARRTIEQGGVKVDGAVITDVGTTIDLTNKGLLIQKGKRHFVKIVGK